MIDLGWPICGVNVEFIVYYIFKCHLVVAILEVSGMDNSSWNLDMEHVDLVLYRASKTSIVMTLTYL